MPHRRQLLHVKFPSICFSFAVFVTDGGIWLQLAIKLWGLFIWADEHEQSFY